MLIDLILSHLNNKKLFLNILDIGTGSGCILISLLKELIKAKGIGIDKSKKAIAIAKIDYWRGSGIKGFVSKLFFTGVGQVPIDRAGGSAAEAALRTAIDILNKGDDVNISWEPTFTFGLRGDEDIEAGTEVNPEELEEE